MRKPSSTQYFQAQTLSTIVFAMCIMMILQSFKLMLAEGVFMHLLNLGSHLLLFIIAFQALRYGKPQYWPFHLIFYGFLSYICVASLLWQANSQLQLFIILAIFVASALYMPNQKWGFSLYLAACLSAFFMIEWCHLDSLQEDGNIISLLNIVTFMLSVAICAYLVRYMLLKSWKNMHIKLFDYKDLLLKIFPNNSLHLRHRAIPFVRQELSVISLDLVAFTERSQDFVEHEFYLKMHNIFGEIDAIIIKNNAYRLKTNGDQILILVGLDSPLADIQSNAINACQLACEIRRYLSESALIHFDCRIGIASGQVIIHLTSDLVPTFDAWGKTVIRASRLEQYANAEQCLLDAKTTQLINGALTISPGFTLSLKGLGDCQVAYLHSCL